MSKTTADPDTQKKIYCYSIPFKGQYIIYRPLLHAAFVGNYAMVRLVRSCLEGPQKINSEKKSTAYHFLDQIGFLEPDPLPPASLAADYMPTTAVLLMTNRCNLRCVYCYAAAGEMNFQDMSRNTAFHAVDIVYRNAVEKGNPGFELVFHGGGEPCENWEVLKKSVHYARKKDLKANISMSSNGIWTNEQQDFLLDNLDGLSLSFDGTKEIQNRQRPFADGSGSFEKVIDSIDLLDRKCFPYNIRLTVSSLFLEKLPEAIRFICRNCNCRHIQVEPAFAPARKGWKDPQPDEAARYIDAFIESMDIAQEYGRELMFAGARVWMTICAFCSAAHTALVVRPDNRLVACYEVTDNRHELAEIFTIGELTEKGFRIDETKISRIEEMRKQRLKLCSRCFCIWHCGGDCSSRCFTSDGTGHLRFSQRCRINREISKEILARYIESSGGVWQANIKVISSENETKGSLNE